MFGFLFKPIKIVFGVFKLIGNIGRGLLKILEGIGQEIIELPQGLAVGAWSLSRVIIALFIFSVSNFLCLIQLLGNFTSCIGYYILQFIGMIFYLIPWLVFMILDFGSGKTKLGSKIEFNLWYYLDKLDRYSVDFGGPHIIYFSKSVRDRCFSCKRLKPVAITRNTSEFVKKVEHPIIPFITGGLKKIFGGFDTIVGSFDM
tara:strand:+ start:333 stop:935 length:603 start_codon:yes stop_codon:yes gene_type:complete